MLSPNMYCVATNRTPNNSSIPVRLQSGSFVACHCPSLLHNFMSDSIKINCQIKTKIPKNNLKKTKLMLKGLVTFRVVLLHWLGFTVGRNMVMYIVTELGFVTLLTLSNLQLNMNPQYQFAATAIS